MAAVSFIGIGALYLTARELLRFLDHGSQRMPAVWISRQRLGVQDELAAGRAGVGGDDRDLDAELVEGLGLAPAGALDLHPSGRSALLQRLKPLFADA